MFCSAQLASERKLTRSEALVLIVTQQLTGVTAFPEQVAPAPSLEGVTVLRVTSSTIPQVLRNKLRWPQDRYEAVGSQLSAGPEISLDTDGKSPMWRTVTGETVNRKTVEALFWLGILTPEG